MELETVGPGHTTACPFERDNYEDENSLAEAKDA
jgi:hypothetical protein